jgi:hypothetical protein
VVSKTLLTLTGTTAMLFQKAITSAISHLLVNRRKLSHSSVGIAYYKTNEPIHPLHMQHAARTPTPSSVVPAVLQYLLCFMLTVLMLLNNRALQTRVPNQRRHAAATAPSAMHGDEALDRVVPKRKHAPRFPFHTTVPQLFTHHLFAVAVSQLYISIATY